MSVLPRRGMRTVSWALLYCIVLNCISQHVSSTIVAFQERCVTCITFPKVSDETWHGSGIAAERYDAQERSKVHER